MGAPLIGGVAAVALQFYSNIQIYLLALYLFVIQMFSLDELGLLIIINVDHYGVEIVQAMADEDI